MSCNACLSRCSAFKCWLNCWIVLWIACRQLAWCCRGEDKRAEDSGVGWWAAALGLDWFVGWREKRRKVPSVMCWSIEVAWDGVICGGIRQITWAKGRLIEVDLPSEIGGSEGGRLAREGLATSAGKCSDRLWKNYRSLREWRCALNRVFLTSAIPKDYFPCGEFLFLTVLEMLIKAGSFCSPCVISIVFTAMLTSRSMMIRPKFDVIGTWKKGSKDR